MWCGSPWVWKGAKMIFSSLESLTLLTIACTVQHDYSLFSQCKYVANLVCNVQSYQAKISDKYGLCAFLRASKHDF